MRGLMRNKRKVFYKNFVQTVYEEDSSGNKTGKKKAAYTDAKFMFASVSTPTGTSVLEMFGTNENYDKIVVADMPSIEITENSILWLDHAYGEDVPHDYVVLRVVRNHNFLHIATRKVDVR